MNKINLLVKILFLAILRVDCMQNCISDAIFLQNDNFSIPKDENLTIYVSDDVINVNSLNKSEDLPYNAVPEISSYERGT